MRPSQCLAVRFACVHDAPAGSEPSGACLDPTQFLQRVDELCCLLEPVDWQTFAGWKHGRGSLPPRSFLLTFDDTLRDHAEIAAPILATRGLRGAFFVATAPLVTGRLTTSHQIHCLLGHVPTVELQAAVAAWLHANAPRQTARSSESRPENAPADGPPATEAAELRQFLLAGLPPKVRRLLIDELFERWLGSPRAYAEGHYLTWSLLAELQAAGHTIGGHGHLHESYARLSAERSRHDLERSADILREGLGDVTRPFAYPYGDCTEAIVEDCRSAGFADGFTLESAWIRRGSDDFTLGRCCCTELERFLASEGRLTPTPDGAGR